MIDGLSMRIYQDGKPKGNATLPRLVTDCDSDVLELGQEGTATPRQTELQSRAV